MRPVDRGSAPRKYTRYGDAIGDLEERIGIYCSYCERRLPVSLAVEHMAPKSHHPDLELEWDNFLLGCTNCNSVKGDREVSNDNLLWPDRDNTMMVISYFDGGFVRIAQSLDVEVTRRAQNLIELVGLDRHEARNWPDPAERDKRWKQREEIWSIAEKCRDCYEQLNCSRAAEDLVVEVALGYGFFSVWMRIFNDHSPIKQRLSRAFIGTALDCFDSVGDSITRPGGVI